MPASIYSAEEARIESALQEAIQGIPGVQTIQPFNVLCNANICRLADHGEPLYWDVTHLSAAGSRLLEPELTTSLQSALRDAGGNNPSAR